MRLLMLNALPSISPFPIRFKTVEKRQNDSLKYVVGKQTYYRKYGVWQ